MDFKVSLTIVAYNEQDYISGLLEDFLKQTYPKKLTEIVLVDSGSSDNTKDIMLQFKKEHIDEYADIIVDDNPKRILACGCNIAINNSTGDIIIRVDAHAQIPPEFVENNVKHHEEGEMVTGGARPNIIDEDTPWKRTLLMAESSMFGSSVADYRRNTEKSYVKSIFHGAVRREVFEKVGIYNEGLGRTEDNEMYYRVSKGGYKICMCPDVISYQQTRSSLKKMLKQKYGNGYWIGRTLAICPKCMSIYHFVPFAFVIGCVLAIILGFFSAIFPILYFSLYGAVAVGMTVLAIIGEKKRSILNLALPVLFFLLHFCYGVGTLCGLCGLIKKPPTRTETRTVKLEPKNK